MNQAPLNKRIAQILTEQGLKKVDFARTLGVSANYISLLVSGKKQVVSVPLARLIESTYGYRAEWVLTGEEPVHAPSEADRLREDAVDRLQQMDAGEIKAVTAYMKMLEAHEAAPSKISAAAESPANRSPDFEERLKTLTQAEHRVYELYREGFSAKQITEQLGVTLNTVKAHSKKIFKKLGVRSRKDLFEKE